jgi:G:T/U-mismatch repair DNA glycosylase
MRIRALFASLFLLAAPLLAQEPPKTEPKTEPKTDDPVAAELLKDKEAYVAAVEKAKEEMLKAFDKLYESVKNNKFLKIDAQLAQLEKIEEEKKAFDEKGVPPALPAMKVPLSEYRTAQKRAEAACKLAFEKAAKAYRDKGEIKTAGATLDEMKEFLANASSASAAVVLIMCGNSNKVLGLDNARAEDGTRVVTADYAKGDQTQLWKVVSAGDGWSYIENVKTGMVMTANGKNNGTDVVVSKKAQPASEYQLWKLALVPNAKGAVRVVPKPSGKPIGIFARSKDAGAHIVLWTDENEPHRLFGFFPPK